MTSNNYVRIPLITKEADLLIKTKIRVNATKEAINNVIKEIRSNYRLSELILKRAAGNK